MNVNVIAGLATASCTAAVAFGVISLFRTRKVIGRADRALHAILLLICGAWIITSLAGITVPFPVAVIAGVILIVVITVFCVRSWLCLRATRRELDRLNAELAEEYAELGEKRQ